MKYSDLPQPWIYIFTYRPDNAIPYYETSMPGCCIVDALRRLQACRRPGFLSVGCLPSKYFY
jgi:hypothetical protein